MPRSAAGGTAADAFVANCRHIARFEVKPHPKPQREGAVTLAVDALLHGKLVQQLRHGEPAVRAHALAAARDLLVVPLQHARSIAAGMTPALVELLADSDPAERAGAAAALQQLMARGAGLADALQHAALPRLLALLQQTEDAPRGAAYGALGSAARQERGRAAIAAEPGALAALLHAATQHAGAGGSAEHAAAALELLRACVEARHAEETRAQLVHARRAVRPLAALLVGSSTPRAVWLGAARLLGALASTQEDARAQAADAGCVAALLAELSSGDGRASTAAGALMAITQSPAGKEALAKTPGGPAALAAALAAAAAAWQAMPGEQRQDQALLAVLQVLANAAELPACRQQLQGTAGALRELAGTSAPHDGGVARAAAAALRLVDYRCWPG